MIGVRPKIRVTLDSLPADSFVEYEARRLANPVTIWRGAAFDPAADPLDFAYCNPCDGELDGAYRPDSKTLRAERYGGQGLAGNGGGVRCGLLGTVQIKGTGKNALAGARTDAWHKHGASSLQDCVREAIWGEILEAALPHGAARTSAIISSRSRFAVESIDSDGTKVHGSAIRAIQLREATVRPAHFMRSVFFEPEDPAAIAISDRDRTASALQALDRLFAGKPGDADVVRSIFERCADQIAASRARRLAHGSLTASNFSVDGRWLDFGTFTALSSFRDISVAPGSAPVWSQERLPLETLRDLTFYKTKYLNKDKESAVFDGGLASAQAFARQLQAREPIEFLMLTGAPEAALSAVDATLRGRLWACFQGLLHRDRGRPALYYGDDRHEMPLGSGLGLIEVLDIAAVSVGPAPLENNLAALGLKRHEASGFAAAYWQLREQVIARLANPQERQSAQLAFTLLGLRLNGTMSPLWRRLLDGRIDAGVRAAEDISALIDQTSRYWAARLGRGSSVELSPWFIADGHALSGSVITERLGFTNRHGVPLDGTSLAAIRAYVQPWLRCPGSGIGASAPGTM